MANRRKTNKPNPSLITQPAFQPELYNEVASKVIHINYVFRGGSYIGILVFKKINSPYRLLVFHERHN